MAAAVASVTWYAEDSATPCTVSKPTGYTTGDLLVGVFIQHNNPSAQTDLTAPTGWTAASGVFDGVLCDGKVFTHVFNGADPATWNFPYKSTADVVLGLFRITDADTTTPTVVVSTTPTTSVAATSVCPSVTPTGADDLLICVVSDICNGTLLTCTIPGGMTDQGRGEVSGHFMSSYAASQQLSSSAATGTRSFTSVAPTGITGGTWTIAVKSAASTGVAESGTGTVGGSSTAVGRKVAAVVGRTTAGVSSTVSGRRVAGQAGRAAAGAVSTGVVRRTAVQTGAATVGGVSTAVGRRVAVTAGRVVAGTSTVASGRRVTGQAGTGAVATSTVAAGRRVTGQAGQTSAGIVAAAAGRRVTAQTSRTATGAATSATGRRVVVQAGTTVAGGSTSAAGVQVARPVGRATAGVSAAAVETKRATPVGGAGAGVASSSVAARSVAQSGKAVAGFVSAGTARKTIPAQSIDAYGVSASAGLPARTAAVTARTCAGTSGSGRAGKTTPTGGRGTVGATSGGAVFHSGVAAESGTVTVGAVSRATVTKAGHPAGWTTAGVLSTSARPIRVAVVSGRCTAGTASSTTPRKSAGTLGTVAAGIVGGALPGRRAPTTGTAAAGFVVRVVSPAGRHTTGATTGTAVAAAAGAVRLVSLSGRLFAGVATAGTVGVPVPPLPVVVSPLFRAASAVLDCVAAGLAGTPAGLPGRVCVVPGVLAWDGCDCGVLAVSVTRVYPSRAFPTDASGVPDFQACPVLYLAADLSVTVLRCAPNPDDFGQAPSCDELTAAAVVWRADAAAVRAALACCLPGLRDAGIMEDFALRGLRPVGPEGGCVGAEQTLTVALCAPGCP